MIGVRSFYRTSIGKKTVMAVTGLIGIGYVVIHLAANLFIFIGQNAINQYSAFLHGTGPLLWVARIILLAAVIAHIVSAVLLTIENRKARQNRYVHHRYIQANYAVRSLRIGGIILLLFIIYHVLHLTLGAAPGQTRFAHGDVYNNVIYGFQNPFVSAFYILAVGALGLHVLHGLWSMFHTLGLNNNRFNRIWRNLAVVLALFLFVGNISIPISVLLGILQPTV